MLTERLSATRSHQGHVRALRGSGRPSLEGYHFHAMMAACWTDPTSSTLSRVAISSCSSRSSMKHSRKLPEKPRAGHMRWASRWRMGVSMRSADRNQ